MKIDSNSLYPQTLQKRTDILKDTHIKKDFNHVLDNAIKTKDNEKLYSACQDLESVFINKVLDAMRTTIPHSDFINRGFATETFESMLFEEYAKDMSKTGSLGIADILFRQLSQKK